MTIGKDVFRTPRQDRFGDLVRYICARCPHTSLLGATKLNKILWYIDTLAFRQWGRTVSGETAYKKLQYGPVPKRIDSTLEELEQLGFLKVEEELHYKHIKRKFLSADNPDNPYFKKVFNKQERELMNDIIEQIAFDHTATSISELSHDAVWKAAGLGEDIPVFAVLAARSATLTSAEKESCRNSIDRWRAGSKKIAAQIDKETNVAKED